MRAGGSPTSGWGSKKRRFLCLQDDCIFKVSSVKMTDSDSRQFRLLVEQESQSKLLQIYQKSGWDAVNAPTMRAIPHTSIEVSEELGRGTNGICYSATLLEAAQR
jgi:1,2-phenylacetyl-CoA epoxidase catalytic subunit